MTPRFLFASITVAALAALSAATHAQPAQTAQAALAPTAGNTAAGTVSFEGAGDRLNVRATLSGLKPNAEHGFHLHERGDCSAPDANSAGGHFNPDGKPHGPPDAPHHAGDMPALKADADGRVDVRFTLQGVTIGAGATDIVGRAVIVHAQPDDYRTQPTGNSGARIACGVVARR